ncbi:hypothetical protein ILYODFUR_037616 [Ilyodon furcidens]|uniref:Uncharacterized protein n=1 Tax=Ilyodon furcidens TaxID=33524 RepID=A0ABV0TRV8_9TELE
MHTHKITRTQRKDKQQWTSYTHSHSPCTLYTLRSRRWYPLGATSPQTQEVVPFPPGAETGRQRRHHPDPGDPGKRAHTAKTHPEAETSPPQDQPRPARILE